MPKTNLTVDQKRMMEHIDNGYRLWLRQDKRIAAIHPSTLCTTYFDSRVARNLVNKGILEQVGCRFVIKNI